MAVSTGGAKAADAIVMAEPEPMEYVRICDVYGTGFFYIPGTETCMHINGYYRFQTNFDFTGGNMDWFSRFQLNVDVRSETEWGTLRGYAEGRFDYGWMTTVGVVAGAPAVVTGYATNTYLNQGYIELITASGTLRLGKSDAPYARFLGYGGVSNGFDGGHYGFSNSNEISYQFNGSNGFSAIVALMSDGDLDYVPDIEAGLKFVQGWGLVGLSAGYDESAATWGVRGAFRYNAPNGSFVTGLLVNYSSGAGRYAVGDPGGAAGNVAPWAVMGYVKGNFTPTTAAFFQAQWFSNTGGFELTAGLDLKPITNFRISPEVRYRTTNSSWHGVIRFQRDIP
ncbi:MAG: porin [Rhizobiaceae bacterium]